MPSAAMTAIGTANQAELNGFQNDGSESYGRSTS